MREILEFISRCNDILEKDLAEKKKKDLEHYRVYNSKPHAKISRKNYEESEKGQIARRRVSALRSRRVRNQSDLLSEVEKEIIREFYAKCPEGFHVDHVIPISKGGRHVIENLQYLNALDNFRKSKKLGYSKELDGQINKTLN